MHRWLRVFLERPAESLRWILVLTLVAGAGLSRLEVRTDGAAIHPTDNPTVVRTHADRETFRDADQVLVLVTSKGEAAAFASASGLRRLKQLHRSVGELPEVSADRVRSAASLLDPDPNVALVEIEAFLDHIPDDRAAYTDWLERLRASPLAGGLYLSDDGRAAALYVPIAEGESRDDFVDSLRAWTRTNRNPALALRLTGPVVAEVMLGRAVLRDLAWLIPIMLGVMALLLFLCLGTPGGVLIPLAEVLIVLVWTLGCMGHFGVPITLVTTILPVVLMTMAVTDEVHLLERFQFRLRAAASEGVADELARRREAMRAAIADVGRPIVLTSLTTSVGFLSFLAVSIEPVRHFGLFTAIGIVIAMLTSFSFVPALALVLPASWFESRLRRAPSASLARHEAFVVRHAGASALLGLLLVLAAAPGLFRLTVQDSWIGNFDSASELVAAERDFNAYFWGSYRTDIVLESPELRFFQQAEGLKLMEDVREVALRGPGVGGVASHLIPFQTVAAILGEAGPVSALRRSALLRIVPLSWSTAYRPDLEQLLKWKARSARARLFVNSPDYARAAELRDYLNRELPRLTGPAGVTNHLSGDLPVATEVVDSIVGNQLRSLSWALAGVAVLLCISLRSLVLTALVMAPLAAAIPLLLGVMGYTNLPLGIATSMFTALAIGVGVDFALHFLHAYQRARQEGSDHEASLVSTLLSSGRAIRWNASVLSLGFLVLTLSAVRPNRSLGLLLSGAMLACYAMTLLLLPRLLRGSSAG